jgi:hypothetical protein
MLDFITVIILVGIAFGLGWITGSRTTPVPPHDDYDPYDPLEYYNRTDVLSDKERKDK